MILLFLAAQAAAATPPAEAPAAKPKQVCRMVSLTGSRSKRRVCEDKNGQDDAVAHGVSSSGYGKAMIDTGSRSAGGFSPQ